jgi:hypothetical protein
MEEINKKLKSEKDILRKYNSYLIVIFITLCISIFTVILICVPYFKYNFDKMQNNTVSIRLNNDLISLKKKELLNLSGKESVLQDSEAISIDKAIEYYIKNNVHTMF